MYTVVITLWLITLCCLIEIGLESGNVLTKGKKKKCMWSDGCIHSMKGILSQWVCVCVCVCVCVHTHIYNYDVYFEYLTIICQLYFSKEENEWISCYHNDKNKVRLTKFGDDVVLQISCIAGVSEKFYNCLENDSTVSPKACSIHIPVIQKFQSCKYPTEMSAFFPWQGRYKSLPGSDSCNGSKLEIP